MNELQSIAKEVCKLLKTNGFIVQRYDCPKVNSIFLKLDYDPSRVIRIGETLEKSVDNCRYHLLSYWHETMISENYAGGISYYYPSYKITGLIEQVIYDKQLKIKRIGQGQYDWSMRKVKEENLHIIGYWKKSKIA